MFIDVLIGFIWNWGACKLGWHKWDKERGFEGRPHHTAVCKRCGATPKEYNNVKAS